MNRREFVALVGVGGAMACAPEILGTATDQEMTPAQAADGFVKVTGITLKELEAKGTILHSFIKLDMSGIFMVCVAENESNLHTQLALLPYYPYMRSEPTLIRG